MEYGESFGRIRKTLAQISASDKHSAEDRQALHQIDSDLEEVLKQLTWLSRNQRVLDQRLGKIEQSLLFRLVRWPGTIYMRLGSLFSRRFLRSDPEYERWISHEQQTLFPGREECLRQLRTFARQPLITVVIAAHDWQPAWLHNAIESVARQFYPFWELCICFDGKIDPLVMDYLDELSRTGSEIHLVEDASWSGVSAALNSACARARGEYIGFLAQHDLLSPYALFYVAEATQRTSPVIVYSDEDTLSADGRRSDPLFKPAWSPTLLLSTMYLSHFLAVSREAFDSAGGFRSAYDGAEAFDLSLRITEPGSQVNHIPRILYHKRAEPEARVQSGQVNERVIRDAIQRKGWTATVVAGESRNCFRIKRLTNRLVSIIICSKSPKLLEKALKGIKSNTTYTEYELVVAEHCPEGENTEIARIAAKYRCVRVPIPGPFNFSSINNAASERSKGDIFLFLNDDVEPLRGDWLENLISDLELQATGVVGAKLLYPSGAVQHAGVVVGIGDGAGHINRHRYRSGNWKWMDQTRNVSAVTGACLAIRAEVFRQVGGFNPLFPNNYNDVDLCLRAQAADYKVVYEPAALLRHYEGRTRASGVHYEEREAFYSRWHQIIESGDPYYNPNLAPEDEEARLRFDLARGALNMR